MFEMCGKNGGIYRSEYRSWSPEICQKIKMRKFDYFSKIIKNFSFVR